MDEQTGLRRGLSARHVRFMALGSAIGTGLFYGSAAAIQRAGPSVLLAYLIGGAAIFFTMRALERWRCAIRCPLLRPLRDALPGAVPGFPDRLELCLFHADGLSGRCHRVRRVHGFLVSRHAALDLGAGHRAVHRRLEPVQCEGVRRAGVLAVPAQGRGDPGADRGRRGGAAQRHAHRRRGRHGAGPGQPVAARRLLSQRHRGHDRVLHGGDVRLRRRGGHRHGCGRGRRSPARHSQGDQFGAAAHPAVLRADSAGADGDLPWSKIGTQGSPSCRYSAAWASRRPRTC